MFISLSPSGEVITQINATDSDVDANAEMVFSMSSLDSATSGFFHLSSSGQLVLLRRGLDREKQAKFGFLVTVTNTAPPQLSSTATLVVTILDINDCSPQVRGRGSSDEEGIRAPKKQRRRLTRCSVACAASHLCRR